MQEGKKKGWKEPVAQQTQGTAPPARATGTRLPLWSPHRTEVACVPGPEGVGRGLAVTVLF